MLDQRLIKEVKQNKIYLIIMVVNGFASFVFSFATALLIMDIVDALFLKKMTIHEKTSDFIALVLVLLCKSIVTYFIQRYFKINANILKNKILLKAVNGLLKQGPIATGGESSGGVVTSWSEAADHIEPFYAEYLPQFFALLVTVPLLLVIAFCYDWISACIMLVTGPLLPFFLALIGIQSREANKERLSSLSKLGDSMLDFLNGIRTLKLFNGEREYREIIVKNSEKFRVQTMQVLKIAFLSAFVLEFAATISTAMIAVSLGIRLLYGKIEFDTAFLILLITPDYYMAIRKFGAKFHTAMGAKAAADTLYSKDVKEKENQDKVNQENIPICCNGNTTIEVWIKDLSYQYKESDRKALDHLSLRIAPGNITALVGKSGAGKSTLAFALMRFIHTEGAIFFNQIDISRYKEKSIRSLISYIPQKPHIFQDTLRKNLQHSKPDATDEECLDALEKAALLPFARNLPEGLDTILTEVGTSISAGEAQRLAFARAYLKDSPIVIMDETTSALDAENEKLLSLTFRELYKSKTVLIIAHRLETVKHADTIYVLEHGRVTESGNHDSLIATRGPYWDLVNTWGGQP